MSGIKDFYKSFLKPSSPGELIFLIFLIVVCFLIGGFIVMGLFSNITGK